MDDMTRRDAVKVTAVIAGLGVAAAASALAQEPAKAATRVETDSLGPVNVRKAAFKLVQNVSPP